MMYIVMVLYNYGLYIEMAYVGMALYSYGLGSHGPIWYDGLYLGTAYIAMWHL